MDFVKEFKRRCKAIDESLAKKPTKKSQPLEDVPQGSFNVVVKDMAGKVIKILAYNLRLKECLIIGKLYEKSKLIKESEGLYTLHYVKIERRTMI